MADPIAVPVLMKALDFLFGEAAKILQERRERRRSKDASVMQSIPQGAIVSKEEALAVSIDDTRWSNVEKEVEHLLSLLEIYKANYYLAKEQYAKFGGAMVPPIIMHNLQEAEDGISETVSKLERLLEEIYGRRIVVPR